jgi:hypothetical protein
LIEVVPLFIYERAVDTLLAEYKTQQWHQPNQQGEFPSDERK